MNLSAYLIVFVLAAIMGAGLPGPRDASLIAAANVGRQRGWNWGSRSMTSMRTTPG
jgi:hypothetical protein